MRCTCLPRERNHSVIKTASVDLPTPPLSPVKTISASSFMQMSLYLLRYCTVSYRIVLHHIVKYCNSFFVDSLVTSMRIFVKMCRGTHFLLPYRIVSYSIDIMLFLSKGRGRKCLSYDGEPIDDREAWKVLICHDPGDWKAEICASIASSCAA